MAYTTPRTWVPGEIPTAAQFNTHIRDNQSFFSTHAHSGDAGDGAPIVDYLAQQSFAAR